MPKSPSIEITYCRLCGWGLRAGWMAQELLATFAEELGSVTLTPDVTGGVFGNCRRSVQSRKVGIRTPKRHLYKKPAATSQTPCLRNCRN